MSYLDSWNNLLIIWGIGLLSLTTSPQPKFHALIMLCTGFWGMQLSKRDPSEDHQWSISFVAYIAFNFITLALSPLQILLVLFLRPKGEVDYGIDVLHEDDEISVDIVAVHGLGSNPSWAWTFEDKETGKKYMWLKEFLPKSFPRSRIMAYNHNTAWMRNAPVKSVRICGEQMLDFLCSKRRKPEEMERPIIFIGHSFGGVIIKQALVTATEKGMDSAFQSIQKSAHGVLFLGVPHDGSQLTAWGMLISFCTYWLGSSTELLESLQPGARELRDLNDRFLRGFKEALEKEALRTVYFYETHKTEVLGLPLLLGVDQDSSTNTGMKRVPLEANHIMMNKFGSETRGNYPLVLDHLTEMVNKIENEQAVVVTSTQKEIKQSLYLPGSEDRQEMIEKPYESTFEWIDSNPTVQGWMRKESQVIWISGKPGSGKSAFAKHLLGRISKTQPREYHKKSTKNPQGAGIVLSFFFNNRGSALLRSEEAFLQAILYQTLDQIPALCSKMPEERYDASGRKIPLSKDTLQQCLLTILSDPRIGSLQLVIDALDECDEKDRDKILKFVIKDLAEHPSKPQIVITSRPIGLFEILLGNGRYPQLIMEELNGNDIHIFLKGELKILEESQTSEFLNYFISKIKTRSQGVFLWVKLVVNELRTDDLLVGTGKELEAALDSIPQGLGNYYDLILKRLNINAGDEKMRMLEWVLFATRSLSLEDFRYAILMGRKPAPDNLASLEIAPANKVKELKSLVRRISTFSGGLLEIRWPQTGESMRADSDLFPDASNGIVQFIHQSVKDFLLQKKNPVSDLPLIDPSKAHTNLARDCLTYLELPDFDLETPQDYRLGLDIPFIGYASINWCLHASLVDAALQVPLMGRLCLKGRGNYKLWAHNIKRFHDEHKCDAGDRPEIDILWQATQYYSGNEFFLAAFYGLAMDLEYLCREGVGRGVSIGDLEMALLGAAASYREHLAQLLLDQGIDANARGIKGDALQYACYGGDEAVEVVQLLLNKGADVNARAGKHGSALNAASGNGDKAVKVVQLLLDKGADVNAGGDIFGNPLQNACINGDKAVNVVQLLLDNGADVNDRCIDLRGSALRNACIQGDGGLKVVQLLLDNGADVNYGGGLYGTALQDACLRGDEGLKVVQLLLDKGADVNAAGRGMYGNALRSACSRGDEGLKVIQLLLDNGADVNIAGGSVCGTALQVACSRGDEGLKVVQLLLDNGADVNIAGGSMNKAVLEAAFCCGEVLEVVQPPLDNEYKTALQPECTPDDELLLNISGGIHGSTALQNACIHGDRGLKVVQLLLDNGADVNTGGGLYGTALQTACTRREQGLKVIQLLLDNGADVNVAGGKYGTALEIACSFGRGGFEVVQRPPENDEDVHAGGGIYGTTRKVPWSRVHDEVQVVKLHHNCASVHPRGGIDLPTACSYGDEWFKFMNLLLHNGADINAIAKPQYRDILRLLISKTEARMLANTHDIISISEKLSDRSLDHEEYSEDE